MSPLPRRNSAWRGGCNKKGRPIVDLTNPRTNAEANIPDSEEGVDIGPATAAKFREVVAAQGGDARVVDEPGRLPVARRIEPVRWAPA